MNDCILWNGATSKLGYGVFKIGGRKGVLVYAHRMAYRLYVGEIPDGMMICHHCDTPRCINPKHFFLGTAKENNNDAWEKGRIKPPPSKIGESNSQAKLTSVQVNSIRQHLSMGGKGKDLAIIFGVTEATISAIKHRKLWASL